MTTLDWVAIIGAAAWVPQVVGWITRRFATPLLRVIPGRSPEIGYTSLGPIFNFPCAISADRKDAIVEKVTTRLTHENGQATEFQWMTLNEIFSQVKSPEGIAEVSRNQPAVALKVSTLVLTEKQIGFQERGFEEDSRVLITALTDRHDHFKKTEPDSYQQLTLKSKEFADLIAFAGKRFVWQEGRYAARLALRVVGVKALTIQAFQFSLTSVEIARLRQNLPEIDRYVRDLILPPSESESRPYRWNWAYPLFDRPDLPVGLR